MIPRLLLPRLSGGGKRGPGAKPPIFMFGAAIFALVVAAEAAGSTAPTTLVSFATDGSQSACTSPYCNVNPTISPSGRYVTFESWAYNMIPNDTNGGPDVFIRDLQTGTTEHISVNSSGVQGNHWSRCPCSMSADGRYVVFESTSSNLAAGDTDSEFDVYIRDRQTGSTQWVSAHGPAGGTFEGNIASSCPCPISADGRYVAFVSWIAFAPDDTNGVPDLYLRDRQTGAMDRLNVDSNENQGNHTQWIPVGNPAMSSDARYITFYSTASNLVPGDTINECDNNFDGNYQENCADVFVRDRQLGITEMVSVNNAGDLGFGMSDSSGISDDGRYVSFWFTGSNLVPGETNQVPDVFVRDRTTHTTERVSVGNNGVEGNGHSYCPCPITGDGRYVTYYSNASNLVLPDVNGGTWDQYLFDRKSRKVARVSLNSSGNQPSEQSLLGAVSGDGQFVAFSSDAALVPGDTNGVRDVFVHRLGDADNDGEWDPFDNCPNWSNTTQNLPAWPVGANDPDCDGFSTTTEQSLSTNPLGHCGSNAWPPDINNNSYSDMTDLVALLNYFGSPVPPAPARYNIAPDPPNGFVDVTDIVKMLNFFGKGCN